MNHTQRMNQLYGLDEPEWPNYFGMDDERLMYTYGYYGEFDIRSKEWATPEKIHYHERMVFALWHEIERRGLVKTTDNVAGGPVYPWEYDARTARRPFDSVEVAFEHDGVVPDDMESFAESIAGGNRIGGAWNSAPGRQGKVPRGWIDDEENMGLYRRECK